MESCMALRGLNNSGFLDINPAQVTCRFIEGEPYLTYSMKATSGPGHRLSSRVQFGGNLSACHNCFVLNRRCLLSDIRRQSLASSFTCGGLGSLFDLYLDSTGLSGILS
jgi:hypothetical protein